MPSKPLTKLSVDYSMRDDAYWKYVENIVRENPASIRDILLNFPTFFRRREMVRFLAHYELFKKIIDVPGSIVELGIYKGASFFTWTKLLESFCPGDRHRFVYGFDHFKGLVSYSKEDHQHPQENPIYSYNENSIRELVEFHNEDMMIPGVVRCKVIGGDILESIPRFVSENPGLRISLLHFDADLYEPTKCALEHLYPLVAKGGVVCLDVYCLESWPGESRAAEEYFGKESQWGGFKKFSFSTCPGGYFVK
jgi:hypothetical protein